MAEAHSRSLATEGRYADGVHLRDRFHVPEERRAEFIAMSHQLAKVHVSEVIERLGVSKCIKAWEFYDPGSKH